jgi:photosystem II stability/assembly factor-like uncharacterized protein
MKQLVLRTALFFTSLSAGLPAFAQPSSLAPWALIPIPSTPFTASSYWDMMQVELPNTTAIWFQGHGQQRGYATVKIYSSTDDGQAWQTASFQANNNNTGSGPSGQYPGNFSALNGQQAWMILATIPGNTTELWHTNTGAANLAVAAVQPPGQFKMVHFFSAATGVVLTTLPGASTSTLFRTTDGGSSWQAVNGLPGISHNLQQVFKKLGGHLWLSTGLGTNTLLHTADAGQSWRTVTTPVDFSRMTFRDAQHGLAFGPLPTRLMYRTSDSGLSWSLVNATGPRRLTDIIGIPGSAGTYISTGSAVLTGDTHGAAISHDEGQTWQDITPPTVVNTVYNAMNGLAADQSGSIVSSISGTYLVRYAGAPLASSRAVASEKAIYPNPST